ncbi:hypothetical protein GCM10009745_15690 [Kribbella yunnanensis]|uniref:Uncharacterized protein n=1 Tax=Kribbella yunnanensis TaxID=190194 RepID=A0ABP4SIZ6_9ACTN
MSEPLTCRSLPEFLEQRFPDYLIAIWAVRVLKYSEGATADELIGEVFVDEIFADGLKSDDETLLTAWFEVVELGLGSPDELLRGIFAEHVLSIMLLRDRRARAAQDLAGPLLGASLDDSAGSSWRTQVGGFGPDEVEPPARVMLSGYLFRGEFFWHSGRYLADRSGIATTEPFARVSAEAGAYAMGVAVAKALDCLSGTTDDDPRHELEKFLAFAGGIDWTTFYRESLEIGLHGSPDSYEISLYVIHKANYGTPEIVRGQDDPVVVPDWRDAAEFGAAVLRAFGAATTEITY